MDLSFSQRVGAKEIPDKPFIETATDDLKNRIWNFFDGLIWQEYRYKRSPHQTIKDIIKSIWASHLNWRLDEMPFNNYDVLLDVKEYFFSCRWDEFFSLVEYICRFVLNDKHHLFDKNSFINVVNAILEKEFSAYRFVEENIIEIQSKEEMQEISSAIKNTPYNPVKEHLAQALKHLADKNNPDFRSSIKESILAVESLCQKITGKDKATLGEALKLMEGNNDFHPALKGAFTKLYGYTSDDNGICHALSEESNLTMADARYMLITCSAFVNYLIDKNK